MARRSGGVWLHFRSSSEHAKGHILVNMSLENRLTDQIRESSDRLKHSSAGR
jgi:hypothetical protein